MIAIKNKSASPPPVTPPGALQTWTRNKKRSFGLPDRIDRGSGKNGTKRRSIGARAQALAKERERELDTGNGCDKPKEHMNARNGPQYTNISERTVLRIAKAALTASMIATTALHANAQSMGTIGLKQAIDLALAHNPDLEYARGDRTRRDLELKIEKGLFIPRFSVGPYTNEVRSRDGNRSRSIGISTSMDVDLPTGGTLSSKWSVGANSAGERSLEGNHDSQLEFSFSQPLLQGAGLHLAKAPIRAALRRNEGQRLDLKESIADTIDEVVNTYREYATARKTLEIHLKGLERTALIVDADNMMLSAGMLQRDDTLETEAGVARRKLDIADAHNEVERTRIELLSTLGLAFEAKFDTMQGLDIDESFVMEKTGIEHAMRLRPDYRKVQLDLEEAREQLAQERNSRLWDLRLNVSSTRSRSGTAAHLVGWNQTDNNISIDLNIPFGRVSRYQDELTRLQADATVRRTISEEANIVRTIRTEVANAVRDATARLKNLQLAKRARDLADEAAKAELVRLHAVEPGATNAQALRLEESRTNAEITLANATREYLQGIGTLHRATGQTLERWDIDLADWGVDDKSSAYGTASEQ